MPTNYWKSGSWNIYCDVCGFKFKMDQIKKRWDNLMVCAKDWEMDHPQKYLKVRETGQAVPIIRDNDGMNNPSSYINVCYIFESNAFADLGVADCMRADISSPSYQYLLDLKNASLG